MERVPEIDDDVEVEHKIVPINGLKLHVAEMGDESSQAVVFLHGFPEVFYSWRHQMVSVANAGFRAVAPDYRGYGLSQAPPEPDKASYADLVADLLGLFDSLSVGKAFIVAKDFGGRVACLFALLYPEKVVGVVTMGVPLIPPVPPKFHHLLPEGFYVSRWAEPGRAEADFGRFDNETVFRKIYILFSRSEIPIANEDQEIMDLVDSSTPLPSWFTQEDFGAYGELYKKSGFKTALQVPYRSMNEEFNIPNMKIEAPALLIMGEDDYVLKFPGIEDFIKSEKATEFVPKLKTVYLPEGTHFVQEQFPEKVNQLLIDFLNSHK